jgi:hypothetical protein
MRFPTSAKTAFRIFAERDLIVWNDGIHREQIFTHPNVEM